MSIIIWSLQQRNRGQIPTEQIRLMRTKMQPKNGVGNLDLERCEDGGLAGNVSRINWFENSPS
jgi:hypothetical protein